jgi:hypothetical protein
MFRYKRIILRENNVPGLKPTASDKPLFMIPQSVVGSVVDTGYV